MIFKTYTDQQFGQFLEATVELGFQASNAV